MMLFSLQISFPYKGFLFVKVFNEVLLLYIIFYLIRNILLTPWRDPGRESKQGKEIINQSINQSIGHLNQILFFLNRKVGARDLQVFLT